jgi:hypothetical protein
MDGLLPHAKRSLFLNNDDVKLASMGCIDDDILADRLFSFHPLQTTHGALAYPFRREKDCLLLVAVTMISQSLAASSVWPLALPEDPGSVPSLSKISPVFLRRM